MASGSLTLADFLVHSLEAPLLIMSPVVLQKRDWLMLVAVHSDTWLYAVAFYNGARLNKDGRYLSLRSIPRRLVHRQLTMCMNARHDIAEKDFSS